MDRDWKTGRKLAFLFLFSALSVACTSEKKAPNSAPNSTSGSAPTSVKIRVNWTANPEVDVNTTGGGYRVYYAKSPNVSTSSGTFVNVPYVSGATAPTTALLSGLTVGTYYVKVVAYSAYNPQGISGGNSSAGSSEVSISVP
jgi:hypothetical protein